MRCQQRTRTRRAAAAPLRNLGRPVYCPSGYQTRGASTRRSACPGSGRKPVHMPNEADSEPVAQLTDLVPGTVGAQVLIPETVDDRAIRPAVALARIDKPGQFVVQRLQLQLLSPDLVEAPGCNTLHISARPVPVPVEPQKLPALADRETEFPRPADEHKPSHRGFVIASVSRRRSRRRRHETNVRIVADRLRRQSSGPRCGGNVHWPSFGLPVTGKPRLAGTANQGECAWLRPQCLWRWTGNAVTRGGAHRRTQRGVSSGAASGISGPLPFSR